MLHCYISLCIHTCIFIHFKEDRKNLEIKQEIIGVDNTITEQFWKQYWKHLFKFLPIILNLLSFLNLWRVTVEHSENCVTNNYNCIISVGISILYSYKTFRLTSEVQKPLLAQTNHKTPKTPKNQTNLQPSFENHRQTFMRNQSDKWVFLVPVSSELQGMPYDVRLIILGEHFLFCFS